jgi:hypothetical protein
LTPSTNRQTVPKVIQVTVLLPPIRKDGAIEQRDPVWRRTKMAKLYPFLPIGFPKLCAGCAQPFPIRAGQVEAIVGADGKLYCYAARFECAELAVGTRTRKAA